MPQQALPKTYPSITHLYIYIYIYIYIHQSRPYQHLRTLNHSLVIILLGNSNNQSCVMYISSYGPPNQISTVHSEELHVMDYLSKFHLNRTVNEAGNAVLRKLRRLEKSMSPGGMKLAPGGSGSTKSTKTAFFVYHHASLVWRLAVTNVPPGDSCCSRNLNIFLCTCELQPFHNNSEFNQFMTL